MVQVGLKIVGGDLNTAGQRGFGYRYSTSAIFAGGAN
jgi:hypothetical protein